MSAENMLQFVQRERQMPNKREAEQRRLDFQEIYDEFSQRHAQEQASRCSQCGVPFCQIHCPLHNNIPDWLMLCAQDRLEEAYQMSNETNAFPEICGRVCPQDRLCEGNCVIEQSDHGTVTIGTVERYLSETAFANDWVKPIVPLQTRKESMGIVGAGPAGLTAAIKLRKLGYDVHVYDRYDRVGGLMIYGLPNFKLDKDIVHRRYLWLKESGVHFHLNTDVGKDISFEDLRKKHASVLIATGVYQSRAIKAPGVELNGIEESLDFLVASIRSHLGDDLGDWDNHQLNAYGKDVVVIGGGDTAMDCTRTAIRQGAKSVTCLYRRDRDNMPGSQREVNNAIEEGIIFNWLSQPTAFSGKDSVDNIMAVKMRLGGRDKTGRSKSEQIQDSKEKIKADLVIKALGFEAEDLPNIFATPQLECTDWNTLKVNNKNYMTSLDGVFAAGDIVRGASLVVWAIKEGGEAAEAMHEWVEQNNRLKKAS